MLTSLIIPLLSFLLQSYPRIFNRYFGVDVWTRLIEIDHVRKARHGIPGKITKGFIIDGYFDYPIVFPWILSFFSKNFLFSAQGFISPVFDCLQNVFLYFLALSIFHNLILAMMAQIVYTTIPMIPIENSYLTPRSFGYFLFTLSILPLILYTSAHNSYLLFIGIAFATLLFLTHRFALQSYLFICLFFAVVDKSLLYIIVPAVSFVAAVVITKGYYLRVAKGHLSNIYFWVLKSDYRFAHQIHGITKTKKLDWVGKIYSMLSTFSPIFLIGIDVWVISAFVYLYLLLTAKVQVNPVLWKMTLWILFFYILGAAVLRIKKLVPIGEGQRYLEMATVPTAILSVYVFNYFYHVTKIPSIFAFTLIALGNLGMILFVQIKAIIKDKNRSLTTDLQNVFTKINKLKTTPRIICIPHALTTMTVYNTKADVLVNADNPGLMRLLDVYPVLQKPVNFLKKKYKLSHLLLLENFAKLHDLKIKNKRIVYKSGNAILIEL